MFRIWHLYRLSAGLKPPAGWGANENSIALGGITAIRSHLGALRQFDRTWGHYGNSITPFKFDCTETPNHNFIARSKL
ncbi:hypothetical protein D0A37_22940 [Microcoleus vaginatus HSN003]|nr:hypothetical protein D0A37_22940 [Microcoleus vaginatus HSN003]